jgi:hypothetical protein
MAKPPHNQVVLGLLSHIFADIDTNGTFTTNQTRQRQCEGALVGIFFQAFYEAFQTNIPCLAKDFEPCGITL